MKLQLSFFTTLCISCLFGQIYEKVEIPLFNSKDSIINHSGYSVLYNSKYKQANWVAYLLTKSETNKRYVRGEFFAPDPLIPGTNLAVDYAKSGYDRGHLAPAADMGYSMETMVQSFYYSNMSPQVPRFNRGIWKKLEMQVRNWVIQYDSLYIVTGPIFSDSMKVIGLHRVAVPKAYYKVLLQKRNGEWFGIGFLLPNASLKGDIMQYATCIDKVEELTGIDFFPLLDYDLQTNIERELFVKHWEI